MFDTLLSYVAPHLCCGCGEIGALLCEDCKYNIKSEVSNKCVSCGVVSSVNGICQGCDAPYSRAWYVGERSGSLQRLIGDFKFQNMYAASHPLADLLIGAIDQLPENTVVVPIPTVSSHIRERGYDHTLLLARQVATRRGVRMQCALTRASSTKQRDASRPQRIAQAKRAFRITGDIDVTAPHILIDDIVTTGATIKYAAQALRAAGVQEVWVAVIARQPLD